MRLYAAGVRIFGGTLMSVMFRTGTVALLAAAMFCAAPLHAAGEDDEAWIASYVASGKAPGLVRNKAQERVIEFDALPGIAGKRARFMLANGRERIGVVEQVEKNRVHLRSQYNSGYFRYSLARGDIRAIRVD
jgi:hypothetical protein